MSTVYSHYDNIPHILPLWASRIENFKLYALHAVPSVCKPSSFPFCISPIAPHNKICHIHTVESLYDAYAMFDSDYWMFEAWNKELLASLTPEEITHYLQTCKLNLNVKIKITQLCTAYVNNIFAYVNGTKIKRPQTEVETEPNERLMRDVEEKIDIGEQVADHFRRTIVGKVSKLGNGFAWDSDDRLKKALKLTIAANNKSWKALQRKANSPPTPSPNNDPHTCTHQWGIDGAHSNEYCKICFIPKDTWDYNPWRMATITKPIATSDSSRWHMSNFSIGVKLRIIPHGDFLQFSFEDINQSGYGEAFNIFYANQIKRCGGPRISTMPRATPAEDAFAYMQTLLTNPRCIIKRSDIHKPMEALIATNGHWSYKYAELINAPFPEGEAEIAKLAHLSVNYATKILKKRFKAGEDVIYGVGRGREYEKVFHDVTYEYIPATPVDAIGRTVFPSRVKCFINDRIFTSHTIEQLNSMPSGVRNEHFCPKHFNEWATKSLSVQGVMAYRKKLIEAMIRQTMSDQFDACDQIIAQHANPDELLEYVKLVHGEGHGVAPKLFDLYKVVSATPYTYTVVPLKGGKDTQFDRLICITPTTNRDKAEIYTLEEVNKLPRHAKQANDALWNILTPITYQDVYDAKKYRLQFINTNIKQCVPGQFDACDKIMLKANTPDMKEYIDAVNANKESVSELLMSCFRLSTSLFHAVSSPKYEKFNFTHLDRSGSMGVEIRCLPSSLGLETSIRELSDEVQYELKKKPTVYVSEPPDVVDDLLNKQLPQLNSKFDTIAVGSDAQLDAAFKSLIPSSPPPLQADTFFKTRPIPDSYPNPMRNLWPMAASGFFMVIFGFIQIIRVIFKYDGWNLTLGIYGLVFGVFAVLHYVSIMQGEQAQHWKKRDEDIAKRKASA